MLLRACFQHLYGVERKRIVTPAQERLRLNRGELPLLLPPDIQDAIAAAWGSYVPRIRRYPSYPPFYQKLYNSLGLRHRIVVGAGIEEFIRTLMILCCDPGQRVAYPAPTCAMYDLYAKAFGLYVAYYQPHPGKRFTVWDLLEYLHQVEKGLRLVFVVNPGQPVEIHFDLDELSSVAQWCQERDIVLAVDEAHHGFGAVTALPLLDEFDNMLVLRTFSKWFGGAGLRVGFAVGQERVIQPLDAVRPSGEISGPSMVAAGVLLEQREALATIAMRIIAARNWLRDKVNGQLTGVKAYGEYGFSVLLEFESDLIATATARALASDGVHVKAGFPAPVERGLLLACGDRAMMQEFYSALELAYDRVR